MTTDKRDLHADLAICNAATTGPWSLDGRDIRDGDRFLVAEIFSDYDEDVRFIAEARTGWPHAIERALDAEALLESHGPDGRNYTNREYVEMRDRALRAEAKVERLTSNCRALFDTLMEALEYVPGEIDAECRQIIEKIRADIYGEEAMADDQR